MRFERSIDKKYMKQKLLQIKSAIEGVSTRDLVAFTTALCWTILFGLLVVSVAVFVLLQPIK